MAKSGKRGSAPGERRGGRQKGTLNKSTVKNLRAAEHAIVEAHQSGKKLAKEVLEDFMHLFAGVAASCQPLPEGASAPVGHKTDEVRFERYARLAIEAAKELAKYQSPTFKAVAVMLPPPQNPNAGAEGAKNVIRIDDAETLVRVYKSRIASVIG
jgi:hypothetical protein